MPKKKTPAPAKANRVHAEFKKAYDTDDLCRAVELARCVVAAKILTHRDVEESELAVELTGYDDIEPLGNAISEELWDAYMKQRYAVFAAGIAVGQLVNADVFRRAR